MNEWPLSLETDEEWRPEIAIQGQRSLYRLRWKLRGAAIGCVLLWAAYRLLVVRAGLVDVGPSVVWWLFVSWCLIQLGFRVALRLDARNVSLWQEMRQRLIQAHTLSDISHTMSVKLTQEDLLPYLAESLTRIVGGTDCAILLRNPYSGELQPVVAYRVDGSVDLTPNVDSRVGALARAVIKDQQPLLHQDAILGVLDISETEPLNGRSVLGLPLWVQGRVIGATVIQDSRERREFSRDAVNQAMVIANQGSVAIANAQLFHEVERRLVELGTLAEISRVIGSSLDLADIHQRVVDELSRAFGYPLIAFYRSGARGLELGAQVGYEVGRLQTHVDTGQGFVGRAASSGQSIYVPDLASSPDGAPDHDTETGSPGVVSRIAMPLHKEGRCLGVLTVESYDPLTEADLSLLQSLSYQISTAIDNARLYAAEQRERQVAHTLLQITSDLSGTLELDRVLNLILERLKPVVPYESAAIGLLSGDVCRIAAAHDLPRAHRLWGIDISPETLPFVGRVLRERTAMVVPDTSQEQDWIDVAGSEEIHCWLGVPLTVKDRTIGLLMLNHDTPDFYDQKAAQLALAFAQHAALAIENARLYEQTQAQLREQKLLYETTTAVSSILDAGLILRTLAERLTMALGNTCTRIVTVDDENESGTLVAQHCSADASEMEKSVNIGEVYQLVDMPESIDTLVDRRPQFNVAGEEPPEWRQRMETRGGQSVLLLPMVARDRLTGFIELWDSRSRRHFTDAEIALSQTIVQPAAVAIENARLFAETQRNNYELMLLYDMAVWAASIQDLDRILQSVVKTLQFRVLEGAVVAVWLLDAPTQSLELRAYAGELEELTLPDVIHLDDISLRQIVQSGEPVLIENGIQKAGFADLDPSVRTALRVPLTYEHQVIGVLQAFSDQPGTFSSQDLRLLRTMAGSLAIGIQNVRLVDDLRRSEDALTLRNQALERANDRLQELDRLKSAFLATVSHELRTPLNSIIGFSEVLIDGLAGEMQVQAQEYLNYIHASGKHLLDLINDILDLSRLQAGRLSLSLEKIDILAVVNDVCTTLSPLIAEKRHALSVEQSTPLPHIFADEFRMRQILINLIGNAIKFTPADGQITVRAREVELNTLRLDISDNGPGISLDDQTVIFEEFRQAHTTRPGEGTGLGLAITRRLVELHGGRIWVESELGAGAVFTVLLPVDGPDEQERAGGVA